MNLFDAVLSEDAEALEKLASEATDINAQFEGGRTALHEAAMRGRTNLVALLLAAGADPSLHDFDHETPLQKAAVHGHLDVVTMLFPFATDDDRNTARALYQVHVVPFDLGQYQGRDEEVPEWKRSVAAAAAKVTKLLGDDRATERLDRVHRSESRLPRSRK